MMVTTCRGEDLAAKQARLFCTAVNDMRNRQANDFDLLDAVRLIIVKLSVGPAGPDKLAVCCRTWLRGRGI